MATVSPSAILRGVRFTKSQLVQLESRWLPESSSPLQKPYRNRKRGSTSGTMTYHWYREQHNCLLPVEVLRDSSSHTANSNKYMKSSFFKTDVTSLSWSPNPLNPVIQLKQLSSLTTLQASLLSRHAGDLSLADPAPRRERHGWCLEPDLRR